MARKIGLRVKTCDEAEVSRVVYPNSSVQTCNVKYVYEMGPLSFGLSRDKVAALLKQWKLAGKPLRPTRSTHMGRYWESGTETQPDSLLLPTAEGEVALTLKKANQDSDRSSKMVQASARTMQYFKGSASSSASSSKMDSRGVFAWTQGSEPWSANPWANYKPRMTAGKHRSSMKQNQAAAGPEVKSKLQVLKEDLKEIKGQLNPDGKDVDMKDTLDPINAELQEVRLQQKKFDGWFNDAGNKINALESQLQAQGSQIVELSAVLNSQTTVTTALQSQVEGLRSECQTELDRKFETQTSRLEALLEKRQKNS